MGFFIILLGKALIPFRGGLCFFDGFEEFFSLILGFGFWDCLIDSFL